MAQCLLEYRFTRSIPLNLTNLHWPAAHFLPTTSTLKTYLAGLYTLPVDSPIVCLSRYFFQRLLEYTTFGRHCRCGRSCLFVICSALSTTQFLIIKSFATIYTGSLPTLLTRQLFFPLIISSLLIRIYYIQT